MKPAVMQLANFTKTNSSTDEGQLCLLLEVIYHCSTSVARQCATHTIISTVQSQIKEAAKKFNYGCCS